MAKKIANGEGFNQSRTEASKDEWLTPPEIFGAFPRFDLDPCAPVHRPWDTALHHYNALDDGLKQKWHGNIWLNSPYGDQTRVWLRNLLETTHSGIALTFARTETQMFFDYVWDAADAVLFVRGRIRFYEFTCAKCGKGASQHKAGFTCPTYTPSPNVVQGGSAGAPSILIAYGPAMARELKHCGIPGKFIALK